MAKFALPLFALLLWLFPRPDQTEGQWQGAPVVEEKAFKSYPLGNLYSSPSVSDELDLKTRKIPDPYEVNPLFRNSPQGGFNSTAGTGGLQPAPGIIEGGYKLIGKMGEYYETSTRKKPEGEEKEEEEEEESDEEKTKDEDDDDDDGDGEKSGTKNGGGGGGGGDGGKEEEEGAGGGGGGGGGGAGGGGGSGAEAGTKEADTKNTGLDQINLIGSDFQPGRLVNIFFGIILLMFMMIAQGYMMWVFGIAFLPGTRALNDWKFNTDALDRAMDCLIDAFEYWNEDKLKEGTVQSRRRR